MKLRVKLPRLVLNSKEFGELPRFYLPVQRDLSSFSIECWIFPLAPFVLVYKIISRSLWTVWLDLFTLAEDLKAFLFNKRKK